MRRRLKWPIVGVSLLCLSGAGVAYTVVQDDGGTADATTTKPTSTSPVTQGDMVVTDTLDGTLGYAGRTTITGGLAGTITQLAPEGSVRRRGQAVYSVDERPVVLLYGGLPAYRTLTVGVEGDDVRQLERNLKALGYGEGLAVDNRFTSYTAARVRDWQEDLGVSETGQVELGSVVFAAGPVRIAEHQTTVGAGTGQGLPVLTGSSRRRVVTVDLPVEQRSLARTGDPVTVTLPDGSTARGRVSRVGTVATTSGDEESGGSSTTIEVKVSLQRSGSAGRLDAAPVQVTFESERRDNVLSVPVNALIASPDGGYAVVVVADDGGRSTVPVELGVFADGRVEVSGKGLSEGMKVEVPAL